MVKLERKALRGELEVERSELIKAINDYNNEHPNNQLYCADEKIYEAKDLLVCTFLHDGTYDVGLFKMYYKVSSVDSRVFDEDLDEWIESWYAGDVYQAINLPFVSIKFSHFGFENESRWARSGEMIYVSKEGAYVNNCLVTSVNSFNSVRSEMKREGRIGNYNFDYTTSSEIGSTLDYAREKYLTDEKKGKLGR